MPCYYSLTPVQMGTFYPPQVSFALRNQDGGSVIDRDIHTPHSHGKKGDWEQSNLAAPTDTLVTDLSSTMTVLSCPFISQNTSLCPLGCKLLIASTLMLRTFPGCISTSNSSPISGPVKNSRVGSPSTGPNSSLNSM